MSRNPKQNQTKLKRRGWGEMGPKAKAKKQPPTMVVLVQNLFFHFLCSVVENEKLKKYEKNGHFSKPGEPTLGPKVAGHKTG